MQNVRRGSGESEDYIIADLHIHDADLIKQIKAGKREVSCGYNAEYVEEDGVNYQKNIVGNHVAIVTEGRAGHKAAIMDSNKSKEVAQKKGDSMKNKFLKALGLVMDTAEALDELDNASEVEEKTEPATEDEKPKEATMDDVLSAISGLREDFKGVKDAILEALKAEEKPQTDEDTASAEESVVVPAEEVSDEDKEAAATGDSLVNASVEAVTKKTSSIEDVQNLYNKMNPHIGGK